MERSIRKKAESPKNAKKDPFIRASEIFSENLTCFQNACEIYKQVLDRNPGNRFCTDQDCKTVYMVEIRYNGFTWGATPNIFLSKDQAKKEAQELEKKYKFVSECRVVTRKIHEEKNKIKYLPADYQS